MLSSQISTGRPPLILEALEPRIAPAGINIGDPGAGFPDLGFVVSGYDDGSVFSKANAAPVQGPALFSGDTNHYFMQLGRGSQVDLVLKNLPITVNYLSVDSGVVYAFFHDKNGDNIVTANELTGLALSAGSRITVSGSVDGDIVANVDARTGLIVTNSLFSTAQSITSLQVSGEAGQIVAGGTISNVSVGKVQVIQSGAPDALPYSFGGTDSPTGQGLIQSFAPAAGQAGGSLINITVGQAGELVAGLGGAGGKGGDIRGITVVADPDGVRIQAGDGGDGPRRGGVGGNVADVLVTGAALSQGAKTVQVSGGDGGDGAAAGGRGGSVSGVWIGYDSLPTRGAAAVESDDLVRNVVRIEGGAGGAAPRAGAGGSLSSINIVAAPVDDGTAAPEIALRGGAGGDVVARGAAGAGGGVSQFAVKNLSPDGSKVLIAGGAASAVQAGAEGSRGAAGGSVQNPVAKLTEAWLVGRNFEVNGGNGALGGAGGSVRNLYFQNGLEPADPRFYLRSLEVTAGAGGDRANGKGGLGGSVQGIFAPVSYLEKFEVKAGAGGDSGTRAGGLGGSIAGIDVFAAQDFEASTKPPVKVTFAAGDGGDGRSAGGRGGSLSSLSFFGQVAALEARAGDGGTGVRGAAGGAVTGLAFFSERAPTVQQDGAPLVLPAIVRAGSGGVGATGGVGGAVTQVSLETPSDITVRAGDGGDERDNGKRAGAGGSVGGVRDATVVGLVSNAGSVVVQAGNGGQSQGAGRGVAGGSIVNVAAFAAQNVRFSAGDGTGSGGVGGNLNRIGFGGVDGLADGQGALVGGKITLKAGDGGDAGTTRAAGGRGGSITSAAGYGSAATLNVFGDALDIRAGDGGENGRRGGLGGSVTGLTIFDTTATMTVVAGNGGSGLARGGAGGSVSTVAFNSSAGAPLLAVAAGDGGNVTGGRAAGAAGGSIDKVNASHDIGLRQGAAYGFAADGTRMGGLFAGAAGTGTGEVVPKPRTSGSVTNITAEAIAAIVAGRGESPLLANVVDRIFLRGNTPAVAAADGSIPDFGRTVDDYAGTGAPTGGPVGVNVNVLGPGARLDIEGFYSGELNFRLASGGGAFDGVVVMYLDTRAGGISSTAQLGLTNPAPDALLQAVVGLSVNPPPAGEFGSVLDFGSDFRPDFAIAFSPTTSRAALFEFVPFVPQPELRASVDLIPVGDSYGFSLKSANLGFAWSSGTQFDFVANYMAGQTIIQDPAESVGAYRTNQAMGFVIPGGNPGSASLPGTSVPVTNVPGFATYTQSFANILGGKSVNPQAPGATDFRFVGGEFAASGSAEYVWNYGSNGLQPLDGLVAARSFNPDRANFMPLAFLTDTALRNQAPSYRLFVPDLMPVP